jgi:hypothetical protein
MLKSSVLTIFAAALATSILPSSAHGYGAAHVGYTHVGPNGVYHTGETAARGPEGGVYGTSHTTAYGAGGSAYHSSTTAAAAPHYAPVAQPAPGYHYAPSYSGAAYGHSTSYGYVR